MSIIAAARPLLNWGVRKLYPYGSIRRVLRGPVAGSLFIVRPAMGLSYALGQDSFHMAWLVNQWRWVGRTVIDIGANRGQLTLLFSRLVGSTGTVLALEPVPCIYADLAKNISLNFLKNARPYCAAASARFGEASFCFDTGRPTQGKLEDCEPTYVNPEAKALKVNTLSLDELVSQNDIAPDFLKIDVEGGAAEVLRGAGDVLERFAPRVFIELHGPDEQQAVKEHLSSRGYRIETMDGINVVDPTVGWQSPLCCRRK